MGGQEIAASQMGWLTRPEWRVVEAETEAAAVVVVVVTVFVVVVAAAVAAVVVAFVAVVVVVVAATVVAGEAAWGSVQSGLEGSWR